jgi:two-component system chemotaxis response regulator CheY
MAQRIMIVDDSISIRAMLRFTLEGAGYEVVEACDGIDALGKLGGRSFNLILSDLNMPNLNGFGLVKAIKQKPAHRFVPVVMLTTEGDRLSREEGRAAGVRAWARKPFEPQTLLGAIAKLALP